MGKATVETQKKKKKGRPSLLDLQKRSLKQQQEQQQQLNLRNKNHKIPNPSPDNSSTPAGVRRSTRRKPNPDPTTTDDEERSSGKRREKKLKLVLKLPDEDAEARSGEDNSGSDEDHSSGSSPRKRKIGSIARGSAQDSHDKGEKLAASTNQTSIQQGSKLDDGPSMPLPDQKLLLFILDRLQKKDTYGVFAEPVDPEELPDYHEVIEHPMDFSTIRKKLTTGSYASLEQFEKDVFLICSNAMQYNSPDTIYFRQARSIQELAKKNFDNLRQDSDDNNEPETEPEPKVVRRGRPPKNLKRPPGRPPLERPNSDFSEATPPSGVYNNRSNSDTRNRTPLLQKAGSADLFMQSFYGPRYGETYIGWSAERYEKTDEITASASKGILMKHGKKQIVLDENRRNTYKQSFALACRKEPSVLTTFDGERKQLLAVGLHTEYGYARSLARFAAKLGPVAWKVASKRIQRCLPAGAKFGPGWVGDNEAPTDRPISQQLLTSGGRPPKSSSSVHENPSSTNQLTVDSNADRLEKNPQGKQLSSTYTPSIQTKSDDGSSKALSPSAAGTDTTRVSCPLIIPSNGVGPSSSTPEASTSSNPNTTSNMSNSRVDAMKSVHPFHNHRSPNIQSRINGLNGSCGLNFAVQMGKMIGAVRPSPSNLQSSPSIVTVSRTETQSLHPPSTGSGEAKLLENSDTVNSSECLPNTRPHQKLGPTPPDLNVGFHTPGSPHSGRTDSVQPDLALQL